MYAPGNNYGNWENSESVQITLKTHYWQIYAILIAIYCYRYESAYRVPILFIHVLACRTSGHFSRAGDYIFFFLLSFANLPNRVYYYIKGTLAHRTVCFIYVCMFNFFSAFTLLILPTGRSENEVKADRKFS